MRISFLVPALVLVGCGTTVRVTPTNTPPTPLRAKRADEVPVFSAATPSRPFVEVALLEAQQESAYSTDDQTAVIAELRKRAGTYGCDALIMNGSADTVVGSSSNGNGTVSTLKGYRATCIVWTKPEAPEAEEAEEVAPPPAARCVPNESRACVGPAGCSGGQACNAEGTAFSPCDCGTAKTASR